MTSEETDDEYKSAEQLGAELVTLSLLPESRWKSLLHLDTIKVGVFLLYTTKINNIDPPHTHTLKSTSNKQANTNKTNKQEKNNNTVKLKNPNTESRSNKHVVCLQV